MEQKMKETISGDYNLNKTDEQIKQELKSLWKQR